MSCGSYANARPCSAYWRASVLWLRSCLTCPGSSHVQVTLQLPSEEEASSKQARRLAVRLKVCDMQLMQSCAVVVQPGRRSKRGCNRQALFVLQK